MSKKAYRDNQIKIFLHKIYSEDALELDAILFEPVKKTKRIVIHIHGKEGHFIQNHFITSMGNSYPKVGYAFLTFNNRGHDYMADMLKKSTNGFEWVQKGTAFDRIEECILDINGVIDYVKNLGYTEIILQGHSLGPHKICYYVANNPKHKIDKTILLTTSDIIYTLNTFVPDWKSYVSVAKKMIEEDHGNELMPIRLWSNALVSAQTYWDYTNEQSNCWVFNFIKPEMQFRHFDSLVMPALVIVPENDLSTGIPQTQAMKMLQVRTKSIRLETHIIKNAIHNFLGKEKELTKIITQWLQEF